MKLSVERNFDGYKRESGVTALCSFNKRSDE